MDCCFETVFTRESGFPGIVQNCTRFLTGWRVRKEEINLTDLIRVNDGRVKADAAQMESAAAYLRNVPLTRQDTRTTLPANGNGKSAYGRSQERISRLGVLLDQEAQNIRGLGNAFTEFDGMMAGFGEIGFRHPVISAGE